MRVIGCISGTSYDAIDACVADLELTGDGTIEARLVATEHVVLPVELRAAIGVILPPATTTIEAVCRLDTEFGQAVAEVVAPLCERYDAELVVSHGQTVFHWVEGSVVRGTLQLGAPAWIAERCGVPVVSDLRSRDVAAGGQGAPLVSILDRLLFLDDDVRRGVLNLGGIANVTIRSGDGVIAWDLGPANALIDAAVHWLTDGAASYDVDGGRAASGKVRADLLDALLDEPYYALAPPKSTGKELFHLEYLLDRVERVPQIAGADLVATVTELTAHLVARVCADHSLTELIASGGGTANPVLMDRIASLTPGVAVSTTDAHGLPSQAKESFAFALMGFLTVHGLPGTTPGATGAPPRLLGTITPGTTPLVLPTPAPIPPTHLVVRS